MGKSLFDEVLGSEEIDIECPACKSAFNIAIGDIGESVTCPHCKAEIQIKNADSIREIQQAMNDLEETLDSF